MRYGTGLVASGPRFFDPLSLQMGNYQIVNQGRDLRDQPLVQRRARLQAFLTRAKCDLLRFSDSFPDADALLAECSHRGLEGIVCKRKDSPYRSGTRSGWIKVKTDEWKAANQYRAKLFAKE